jgi:arylsulfatase B
MQVPASQPASRTSVSRVVSRALAPAPWLLFFSTLQLLTVAGASAPLPHIIYFLIDDFGAANVGFNRNSSQPGFNEVSTPNIDALAASGIILSRHYGFQYCSPTRSALQSGRNPVHVNVLNSSPLQHNAKDPVSGYAGIPRNMTGIAAKLKTAGYATHMVGKWHAGMASMDHTPAGRGYDTSLGYMAAANDFWTQVPDDSVAHCPAFGAMTDLWKTNGPATGLNNSRLCSQTNQSAGCVYEDELFRDSIIDTITAHNASTPLFSFISFHNCHIPLEAPAAFVEKFSFINVSDRALYAAKANHVDTMVGDVLAALRAAGLLENSLIILTSDNGGPLQNANNWPLKGGKWSNWEGGVRLNALVSGGLIPAERRGAVETGFSAIEDWFSTFCALAGVDVFDEKGAAAGLPPVDGLNLWPLLSGQNATSPRAEIVLGASSTGNQADGDTVVQGYINASSGLKILVGGLGWSAWPGPLSPNGGGGNLNVFYNCSPACLFDVLADPSERNDLAPTMPGVVSSMLAHLAVLNDGVFSPNRGHDADKQACAAAAAAGDFLAPFVP